MRVSKRKPLTDEERAEKERFRKAFDRNKKAWEKSNDGRLTQQRLGEIAGVAIQGEPYTQGMVWQYLSPEQDTRMPVKFVQFVASMLGFDPAVVGPGFAVPDYLVPKAKFPAAIGAPTYVAKTLESDEAAMYSMMETLSTDKLIEFLATTAATLDEADQIQLAERVLESARKGLASK
ncbi:MAG: hypothetical protein AAGI72_23555 [Pseudomonadota bacterium]